MEIVKLRDVTTLITKGTTPTTIGCAFTDEGINFIKAEAVTLDGRLDQSVFGHIDLASFCRETRNFVCDSRLTIAERICNG